MPDNAMLPGENSRARELHATCALEWAELEGAVTRLGALLQRQAVAGGAVHSSRWERLQSAIEETVAEREQIMSRIFASLPQAVCA
jgi:hypothetical protein